MEGWYGYFPTSRCLFHMTTYPSRDRAIDFIEVCQQLQLGVQFSQQVSVHDGSSLSTLEKSCGNTGMDQVLSGLSHPATETTQ